MIRNAQARDIQQLVDIYNYYVVNTGVTFEETPIDQSEMALRVRKIQETLPWLVYEEDASIIGYAYASPWKSRIGYRFTVESSIYIKQGHFGKGAGSKLYAELIRLLKEKKMHSVIGGVALPNEASVALHEKFGFKKVAQFEDVGVKFEKWMDVAYWQLQLED